MGFRWLVRRRCIYSRKYRRRKRGGFNGIRRRAPLRESDYTHTHSRWSGERLVNNNLPQHQHQHQHQKQQHRTTANNAANKPSQSNPSVPNTNTNLNINTPIHTPTPTPTIKHTQQHKSTPYPPPPSPAACNPPTRPRYKTSLPEQLVIVVPVCRAGGNGRKTA